MIGTKSKVRTVYHFSILLKILKKIDRTSQIPSINAWHIGGQSAIRTRNWSRVRERGVKKPLKSNLTRRGGCIGPLWSHKFARGCAIAGATGVVRHPIGRCALAARSCISTLANHSFRLIVGKSAALRARCHVAQNAYSLSFSLSRAMEFLGIGCEGKEQCPWIFIVPAGSNSAPANALSQRAARIGAKTRSLRRNQAANRKNRDRYQEQFWKNYASRESERERKR